MKRAERTREEKKERSAKSTLEIRTAAGEFLAKQMNTRRGTLSDE